MFDDKALARFMAKIEKTDTCWLWRSTYSHVSGYGHFSFGGRSRYAHRVAYEHFNGPIPPRTNVCHHCDVRLCVNPDHLFLGSHRDNGQDASRKGRLMRGEDHTGTTLTEADVQAIRADNRRQRIIAAEYGIKPATVGSIRRRRTWGWLP